MSKIERIRIDINGRVQGVGFRPTVYRYAKERELSGWVSNTSGGVIIELEGISSNINKFLSNLKSSPPPQAQINNIKITPLSLQNEKQFQILPSIVSKEIKTQISPDISTCPECLKELFNPKDRRHLYPFLNCTNCGPRFTIVTGIPYDRKNTTMKIFALCSKCKEEYENPENRRFHAQPNACWECGPSLELVIGNRLLVIGKNKTAIKETTKLLSKGKIVAIKGLGGFHLACNALNEKAVSTLRKRKYREDKPFAMMAKNIETIRKFCHVSAEEEKLLTLSKRPIVLLKKKQNCTIAQSVAPNNKYLGFILPYTPLHHLLLQQEMALVMTSGNISDEPISYENKEAFLRLSNIADYFLIHDRDIHTRCDDSVSRIFPPAKKELIIRRSRGYVPEPLTVPFNFKKEILACGAHLKNTFALAKDNQVFVSHHIGDLENLETLNAFEKGIEHFKNIFKIQPKIIAHDLHPEYLSTKFAKELQTINYKLQTASIQHHHAHIASCMADNGLTNRKVIGVALDGTGYGTAENIWGGEFLIAGYKGFERKAHLKYIPMPGGEQAIKEPWRMAATYLYTTYGNEFYKLNIDFTRKLDMNKWKTIEKMIENNINSPLTSSMGRLFDAISSLIGVRNSINYEGQAAIELELTAMHESRSGIYGYKIKKKDNCYIIDPTLIIRDITEDTKRNIPVSTISTKFHYTISEMVIDICRLISHETGITEVALSGGVFQNMILLTRTYKKLIEGGFKVYIHKNVPPNDGGISLGQAVIANYQ